MDAILLKNRPPSGELDELWFDAQGETISVKFEDQDYLEYCGIFGGGFGNRSDLAWFDKFAFVISIGQGYIIDIAERKLIHKTKRDDLVAVQGANFKDYFVAHCNMELYVYGTDLIWTSGRVSLDGIEFDEITNGVVKGRVRDFSDWAEFELDLDTFQYKCDWVCKL